MSARNVTRNIKIHRALLFSLGLSGLILAFRAEPGFALDDLTTADLRCPSEKRAEALVDVLSSTQPNTTPDPALASSAMPPSMDLLKSIAAPAEGVPDSFMSASEVLTTLERQTHWPPRLETLRRATLSLSDVEKKLLLATLKQQYQAQNSDITRYVTYGLADFLITENKSSLYFFRKATESTQDPFLNLIYAMAQAQVDENLEHAPPSEMTARKLDVILRLREAVSLDTITHTPGFWPVFVQVRQRLCANPLYAQDLSDDFSMRYVPMGQSPFSIPTQPVLRTPLLNATSESPATVSDAASSALLAVASPASPLAEGPVALLAHAPALPTHLDPLATTPAATVGMRPIPLTPGLRHQVKFYASPTHDHQITGVVMAPNNVVMGVLEGLTSPNIVEDLEGDGQFELVVRQFNQTPQTPVRVYRFVNGAYRLDPTVAALFE